MKRYPDGVEGGFFYEKSCPGYKPDWLSVTEAGRTKKVAYCTVEDEAGLVWIANLASLEFHTSLSRSDDISRPTMVVFDLDPGEGLDILDCAEAGVSLRAMLAGLGLECFAKTSGGKGLHVYVPLNVPVSFGETKDFAHAVALMMAKTAMTTSNSSSVTPDDAPVGLDRVLWGARGADLLTMAYPER